MPALCAVILGLSLGLGCGGRIGALSGLRLRGEVPIMTLFVVQAVLRGRILGSSEVSGVAIPVWVAVSLALTVCLFLNLKIPGCFVLAMGLITNLAVVLANNGMPVSASMSRSTGVLAQAIARGFYAIAGPTTLGSFAGDVIPVELGWTTLMISMGDVLLMVGVCTTIVSAMLATDTSIRIAA